MKLLKNKCLSFVLILSFLFCFFPAKADTSEKYLFERYPKAHIVDEIIEKRDVNEKHFVCNDGSFVAVLYANSVHHKVNDVWEDISVNNSEYSNFSLDQTEENTNKVDKTQASKLESLAIKPLPDIPSTSLISEAYLYSNTDSKKDIYNNLSSKQIVSDLVEECESDPISKIDITENISEMYNGEKNLDIVHLLSSEKEWDEIVLNDNSNYNQPIMTISYWNNYTSLLTGVYFIEGVNKKYMDVDGSIAAEGSQVRTQKFSANKDQQWFLTKLGDGSYTIGSQTAFERNKKLTVNNDMDLEWLHTEYGYKTQNNRWYFYDTIYGVIMRSASSQTRVLDVYGVLQGPGTWNQDISLYRYLGGVNQFWKFHKLYEVIPYEKSQDRRNNEEYYESFQAIDITQRNETTFLFRDYLHEFDSFRSVLSYIVSEQREDSWRKDEINFYKNYFKKLSIDFLAEEVANNIPILGSIMSVISETDAFVQEWDEVYNKKDYDIMAHIGNKSDVISHRYETDANGAMGSKPKTNVSYRINFRADEYWGVYKIELRCSDGEFWRIHVNKEIYNTVKIVAAKHCSNYQIALAGYDYINSDSEVIKGKFYYWRTNTGDGNI